jgi:uncharacterized metal-binding protein
MPSGKLHSALTLATASGVIAPYLIVNLYGNEYMYLAGCVTGLMVTPDMDVNNGNISDHYIRKVSRPAQWLWRLFWTPYALLVPHRHFVSHFPIVGTILRIGYFFLIINLLNLVWSFIIGLFDTVSFVWIWDWSFFFGLAHVDAVHWAVDNTIKGSETLENGNS